MSQGAKTVVPDPASAGSARPAPAQPASSPHGGAGPLKGGPLEGGSGRDWPGRERRDWARRTIIGPPRNLQDPGLFHKLSLVAFLAWVGLGADGLSSAAYGPEQAYRQLGTHTELALFLALATLLTVAIVSATYSGLIEHFPNGGGGYVVATKLLGSGFGLVSGCALLVDYALTITVSVAGGVDASFSFLPGAWQPYKVALEALVIVGLVVLNLRGVKESVTLLVPVFLLFVATHAALLVGALVAHAGEAPRLAAQVRTSLQGETLGGFALFLVFLRAYAYGAGTYTGIEAVSNGLPILREPKIRTARRTMLYMAISLALTAGGILLCYRLLDIRPEAGKTLNAVLAERVHFGTWFVVVTLLSEAWLLRVAAQTGFLDGPRVMASMAVDSWFPHRFSSLSERLTMDTGVILMGAASIATLLYTGGDIAALVTMYSINVFVTFTLTHLGMLRLRWTTRRTARRPWLWLPVTLAGLVLCAAILGVMVVEKFAQGAWVTLAVTLALIGLCVLIRTHYRGVARQVEALSRELSSVPRAAAAADPKPLDPRQPVAVLLVGRHEGVGLHGLLSIPRLFPRQFGQVIFVSVATVDAGNFKGAAEFEGLRRQVSDSLERYVSVARGLGLSAASVIGVGNDPAAVAEDLCRRLAKEYPRAMFFASKLIFQRERWYDRVLHNETALAIQGRLHRNGLPMVVLPVCIQEG